MEQQPVSERVMRNRGTAPEAAPSLKASVSLSKPWPLPWPELPAMLQPLQSVWDEWHRKTEAEQWTAMVRGIKGLELDRTWDSHRNTPREDWGKLVDQFLTDKTSDLGQLRQLVPSRLATVLESTHLVKLQALIRKHLLQWPCVDGLDPENVWALVCQPVQALNLVLVEGSPESIGQALAQHLVVGTMESGRSAAMRLPGTAVQLTPEQATAASWAANENGLFLRLVEPE